MKTMVAVAPEPKPSQAEDAMAFFELLGITDDVASRRIVGGQRRGQAFVNSLPEEYRRILTGSLVDPYHKDDWDSVYEALDYLLDRI